MIKRILSIILALSVVIGAVSSFAEDITAEITGTVSFEPESFSGIYDNLPEPEEAGEFKHNVLSSKLVAVPEYEMDEATPESGYSGFGLINGLNDKITKINSRDAVALENQLGKGIQPGDNVGVEYIDPMTGALTVTETDLVLPGRDGFDFVLSRYYSSSQAEFYGKEAVISGGCVIPAEDISYIVTETLKDGNGNVVSTNVYPYAEQESAEKRAREIASRSVEFGYDYDVAVSEYESSEDIELTYRIKSVLSDASYTTRRNGLGAGWAWSFPSVQTFKTDYLSTTEIPSAIYYHDGKGNVYEIENNGAGYYFKNYTGKDMTFDYSPHDESGASSRVDYTVTDAELKTYFFGPYGEIRKIKDVYGNEINFYYTSTAADGTSLPRLTGITDSVGRVINFEWKTDTNNIVVTVKENANSAAMLSFSYHREIRKLDGEDGKLSQPVLTGFTDAEGNYTGYGYAYDDKNERAQNFFFNLSDKSFDSTYGGYCEGYINLLTGIYRPASIENYGYELSVSNLGENGASHGFKLSARKSFLCVTDSEDYVNQGAYSNFVTYSYACTKTGMYDYTGYPSFNSIEDMNEGYGFANYRLENDDRIRYIFKKRDGIFLPDSITSQYASGLEIARTYSDYDGFNPQKTEIIYSDNNSGYTSYIYREFSGAANKSKGKLTRETRELPGEPDGVNERDRNSVQYEYDSDGFLTKKLWYQDEENKCIEAYSYDENKRLVRFTDSGGVNTDYSYAYTGGKVSKRITETQNEGQTLTVTETYTADTNYSYPSTVTKTVNGKTETISYTYNMLLGTVATVTDNEGRVTSYEYDNLGRVTKITYPSYESYTSSDEKNSIVTPVREVAYEYMAVNYDGDLTVLQRITDLMCYYDEDDGLNYVSGNASYYTGAGELFIKRTLEKCGIASSPQYVTEKYFYNLNRTQITKTDSLGNTTVTKYDKLGREISFQDEFDNKRITEYNIRNDEPGIRAVSYFKASGSNVKENKVEYLYDRWQRLVSEKRYLTDTEYSEIKYSHDIAGNVVSVTDANGNITRYEYDNLNRVTESVNANNERHCIEYDNVGNVKKHIISNRKLYHRSYDGEGKLLTDTDNAGNSNRYIYNSKGQLTGRQDKADKLYNAYYNSAGNVEKEVYLKSGSSLSERYYGYHATCGITSLSLAGVYDLEENAYILSGSQFSQKLLSPGGSLLYSRAITDEGFNTEISYSYDTEGKILSTEYSVENGEFTVEYEYDKSRPEKVKFDENKEISYEFYPDGKLKKITYPGGILKSEYTYDGLSRLTSLINYKGTQILSSYSYTYDKNGNILTVNETVENETDSVNYTYDKLNRISTVSGTKGADSYYEYDERGNRKFSYEETDFLSEESASFTYDERDRLIYSQVGETSASYSYSPDGYRLRKNNEYYIYDESGRLTAVCEKNGSDFSISRQYIWGPDRVLAQIDGENTYYYLYNGHGDVIQITDSNGNIVNSYNYDVWGNFLKKEETIDNPFTYFGQTYDEETGLYYLRARYYDPATGRFTQQDPAEDGYNWYIYGNQNPVMFVDYTGEGAILTCIILGAIIGFTAGGVAGGVISLNQYGYVKWNWVAGGALLGGVAGSLIGWGAGAIIVKVGVSATATNIVKGGGASFASFDALKKFLGSPGVGNQWHHIVEQCQAKASRAGFSGLWINNTNNVISITKEVHEKISAYYSSIVPNISGNQTIRDWLSTKTFEEQYKFGVKVLEMFGVNIGN